ncbi:CHASE2 domain-containing protein [Candidatus Electronema sp. TJ]|uniref:CHASE2 domain-containing protein n=1 Tax=Candidatus Electronema sp. TJ TaxID=3401573 RepID=UPI003AA94483
MLSSLKKISATGLVRAVGAVISLALTGISLWNPLLLNELRLRSFDQLMAQLPVPLAKPPVVIVDIDPKSLREFGQWPWPRSRTAELIRAVAAAGPTVIGLDMVFAEPDRSSPVRLTESKPDIPSGVRDYLLNLPDNDQVLAETLASSPVPVVLGHIFTHQAGSSAILKSGSFLLRDHDPAPFLHRFSGADANLPLFAQAAQGSGFFNIVPESDAIVRRLPLLINFQDGLYPSLTLAMLQAAAGGQPIEVSSNENGVRAVQVGPHLIPTTMRGELLVSFSAPLDEASFSDAARRLPYISAADILAGRFDRAALRQAYVLVGTSALGLFDLIAVPVSEAFPGVEFHGHALNTILDGSYLRRPEWLRGLEVVQLCVIGLLLTMLLPKAGAAGGLLITLGVVGGSILFTLWNFLWNSLLVDMVAPSATAFFLFAALTLLNYFAEERKTSRLRAAFSQYLAPAVVEELVKNQDSLVLSGEERELSILFSDIRGFTSMAERMRPEALCGFLNEYLTPMTAAVMDRRGTVDKFIGDAVMAFWNAPVRTPEHTRHACECALAMLNELEELNRDWLKRGLPSIHIGIGIHCGTARVGNMGSKQRFEYTVIGDSVNLASRLEGLTKYYGADIVVSGAVHEAVDVESMVFQQIDTVRVVGKSEPVAIFQLMRADCWRERAEEMKMYEKAFALYSFGKFEDADPLFQTLTERHPESKLYALYSGRCRNLIENPPAHWDWITDMRSK